MLVSLSAHRRHHTPPVAGRLFDPHARRHSVAPCAKAIDRGSMSLQRCNGQSDAMLLCVVETMSRPREVHGAKVRSTHRWPMTSTIQSLDFSVHDGRVACLARVAARCTTRGRIPSDHTSVSRLPFCSRVDRENSRWYIVWSSLLSASPPLSPVLHLSHVPLGHEFG